MFANSLDNKPVIPGKNGEMIRDLTQTMFDFTTNSFVPLTAYKVPPDFAMRPDLISQAVYNNTTYAEYILKYNGYSNPYTIDENDVIIIPDLNLAKQNTKTVGSAANDAEKIRNGYKYIDDVSKIALQQITKKIYGYKQQDIIKKHFNDTEFITINSIIDKMVECELKCHYCSEPMNILYDISREAKQWSVDRIDNDKGHNLNNYFLACLECNLKRRRRNDDKFLFTKQLKLIKKEDL